MAISDRDRKRLWGKSGNRCAICRCLLMQPGLSGAREAVIGQEAHIVGERPGSARYGPLPAATRDAYENRVLLCPNDHAMVDEQHEDWTVAKLRSRKAAHEQSMTERTADARSDGLEFDMPSLVQLDTVLSGQQLLAIVGPVNAYVFDHDPLQTDDERGAGRVLLDDAHDHGEAYDVMGPGDQIDAAHHLTGRLREALDAGLILRGKRIMVDVNYGGRRDRWPVAILRLRRAEDVAAEQKAGAEADQALRDGGIEGLEAWAEAARRAAR